MLAELGQSHAEIDRKTNHTVVAELRRWNESNLDHGEDGSTISGYKAPLNAQDCFARVLLLSECVCAWLVPRVDGGEEVFARPYVKGSRLRMSDSRHVDNHLRQHAP
jgi:hypothetical protein